MHDFPLIATIAAAFTAAWVLGLLTQWLRLSPIVGYLLAGVLIGPYTPGFVGDIHLAQQLAEVGVILLMFGVGLHFHLHDLLAVKGIAIPGALGQSLVATLLSIALFTMFGMEPKTGAVIGMAMSVASTVVLMRVLMDSDMLSAPEGHVAVGWLLVEDMLTVVALVLIPVLGGGNRVAVGSGIGAGPLVAIAVALLKLAALVAIVLLAGRRVVPWMLTQVTRLRSRELFTLTVMVFSVAVAAGAYVLFGASMALGAFLAGMVVAQSPVSHQAAADALPLRDAFAVLFFVSVGMLFDPAFLWNEPLMMLAAMGIILIAKPLAALLIVAILGHSVRTALTVALGLAQIGEFSFILSELARKHDLIPDAGHNMLVGGAILSISLNPLLFRSLDRIEQWLRRRPRLWAVLNYRAQHRATQANVSAAEQIARGDSDADRLAIVVGFGPVGRNVDRLLRDAGLTTVIIDMNMDTVSELRRQGQTAIFGDASRGAILELAGGERASHLVLTLPQATDRAAIVAMARSVNPDLKIFVRARYLREREELEQLGATAAIFEEAEAAVALARLVLSDTGAGRESVERAVRDIRLRLMLEHISGLRSQPIRNFMTPWTRVRRLSNFATLDEVRKQVGTQLHSRLPVVDAMGTPIGHLLAKDLVGLNPGEREWTSLVRPLGEVSPDDSIESTLLYFQREGVTMSLVRDHEIPVGIVTLDDILEQVVGRLEDKYSRQPRVSLPDVVLTDSSLLALTSQTAEQAIEELAARIPADQLPPETDVAELAKARERELSTNVGCGVAIPHAFCPNLSSPMVVFGRSPTGVLFNPQSPEQVHLIFLLLTPAEQLDLQVLLLSQVARVANSAHNRRRLLAATSLEEIRAILAGDGPELSPVADRKT
ncbi:MAG: cation:proton antiporter domain-containing protein [Pirellulaceae bacterium]